ncbi:hypothetical protein QR680_008635 [Steinernema hermaphroditum]|uniref:Uncharacterized protein n=1 Tax=Steinernema hermaphroditum TaxID=289476 RepID=A0AA39IJJ4_9BILA|nr:hypothetical protein QR680_008635 [Steinernema hermaphroditum]
MNYVAELVMPNKPKEKAGMVAYEDEWLSDREADQEALQELMRDGISIINDLDVADIVPKVLPHRDMPSVKAACDYDPETSYIEPQIDDKGNVVPTPLRSIKHLIKQGGEEMKSMLDSNYKQPILLQIPAGTMDLKKLWESGRKKKLGVADNCAKERGGSEAPHKSSDKVNGQQFDADELTVFDDEYVHGLNDLENGTKIGKLQFTKSGRCYLKIRGSSERMIISKSVSENKIKHVMALIPERGANDDPMEVLGVQEGGNSEYAHILGVADKHFVCSFETTKICSKNLRQKAKNRDIERKRNHLLSQLLKKRSENVSKE